MQKAEQKLYQEKTGGFMPTPGEFRAYAQAEQYKHSGGAQHIDWWVAVDKTGASYAWHDALKDAQGNPTKRDPALVWFRAKEDRRGIPVNQILEGCGMQDCDGRGKVDLRMDAAPGPRLRIKCDRCGTASDYFEKTREAISQWQD